MLEKTNLSSIVRAGHLERLSAPFRPPRPETPSAPDHPADHRPGPGSMTALRPPLSAVSGSPTRRAPWLCPASSPFAENGPTWPTSPLVPPIAARRTDGQGTSGQDPHLQRRPVTPQRRPRHEWHIPPQSLGLCTQTPTTAGCRTSVTTATDSAVTCPMSSSPWRRSANRSTTCWA